MCFWNLERIKCEAQIKITGKEDKDFQEILLVGSVDLDLVEDPAQGGLVEDFVRMEVCREDHKGVEGHFEFLAGLQGEDVFAFFEGDDPSVHEGLWRFGLAAKVVDDKDTARGFELQRCLIGARCWVVDQIQHVE